MADAYYARSLSETLLAGRGRSGTGGCVRYNSTLPSGTPIYTRGRMLRRGYPNPNGTGDDDFSRLTRRMDSKLADV